MRPGPATSLGAPAILRLADALAVVVPLAATAASRRDATAEAALSAATGRADIRILRRPSGRPALAPPYPELAVSLSARSGRLAAAFSPTARVGVDIEPLAAVHESDVARLASDHFGRGEAARIGALGPAAARNLFLKLWVAKEAVLKITGRGVYDGLNEPDLSDRIDELACESTLTVPPPLAGIRVRVGLVGEAEQGGLCCALAVGAS
jgi:4'-phosphopantetheinyl transferase